MWPGADLLRSSSLTRGLQSWRCEAVDSVLNPWPIAGIEERTVVLRASFGTELFRASGLPETFAPIARGGRRAVRMRLLPLSNFRRCFGRRPALSGPHCCAVAEVVDACGVRGAAARLMASPVSLAPFVVRCTSMKMVSRVAVAFFWTTTCVSELLGKATYCVSCPSRRVLHRIAALLVENSSKLR